MALVEACHKGDLKSVEWLLQAAADPNLCYTKAPKKLYSWSENLPPILTAAMNSIPNQGAIINSLIKAGGSVNGRDRNQKPWVFWCGLGHLPDPSAALRILVEYGLDLNMTSSDEPPRNFFDYPFGDNCKEYFKALIFYGFNIDKISIRPTWKELQQAWVDDLSAAIKLRDEIFAEMVKEDLMKEEALKRMSADVVGVIESYMPISVSDLTPAQRLQLADRCYAKAKS
jgi:hypothetical protein